MNLIDMLNKNAVIKELASKEKRDVLEELCQVVAKIDGRPAGPLVEILLDREKLGSTGIGDGIAIPHGKSELIDEMILACGRSTSGVEFDSMDGRPSHVFFLLLAPEDSAGVHLKALAKISRLLKDQTFRQEFMTAPDENAIYSLIASRDSNF